MTKSRIQINLREWFAIATIAALSFALYSSSRKNWELLQRNRELEAASARLYPSPHLWIHSPEPLESFKAGGSVGVEATVFHSPGWNFPDGLCLNVELIDLGTRETLTRSRGGVSFDSSLCQGSAAATLSLVSIQPGTYALRVEVRHGNKSIAHAWSTVQVGHP